MGDPNPVLPILGLWLQSCTRKGKLARNTIAVGIVVLDHLRSKCPLEHEDAVSEGGEIIGSRYGLGETLGKYGISSGKFLKEVTTRQAHQDGQRLLSLLDYGRELGAPHRREAHLIEAINSLVLRAQEWMARQHLKINCDRSSSPTTWIHSILEEAKGRSGGKVEQHLVGAKLEHRHPEIPIPNYPGHAGDVQTGREGDFVVGATCYHVTAAPGREVVEKCAGNLKGGLLPVLLVPRDQVSKATHLAEDQGVYARLSILAIEDFIALNIIEMSVGDQKRFVSTLKGIVEKYNRRLQQVETDMSLKIELA